MTDKITLANIASFQNDATAVAQYNSNNALITAAIDNTLSRDGTSPNQMSSSLDMNNNQIINLPVPSTISSPARLVDVVTNPTVVVPPTGSSGHTVPFLDGNNTFSGVNAFTASTFSAGSLVSDTLTSCSLVTCALGTPSTGTLTNCTGLPLTTGVTGILPAANGGTGTTGTAYCKVYASVAQTGIASSTYTKLNIDSVVFDANSFLSVANHRLVPTIAGTYLVIGGVYLLPSVANALIEAQSVIYKNGAAYRFSVGNSTTEGLTIVSDLVQMNGSSDYIELFGWGNVSSGTVSFNNSTSALSTLAICRIGS